MINSRLDPILKCKLGFRPQPSPSPTPLMCKCIEWYWYVNIRGQMLDKCKIYHIPARAKCNSVYLVAHFATPYLFCKPLMRFA